jgi:hypothetical protein
MIIDISIILVQIIWLEQSQIKKAPGRRRNRSLFHGYFASDFMSHKSTLKCDVFTSTIRANNHNRGGANEPAIYVLASKISQIGY